MSTLFKHYGVKALFISAAGLLAYEPILWLINTWFDPSYDSTGFTLFLVTGALFIWSLTSPQINRAEQNHKLPILLLFISAFIRLIGQIFAINIIGAFTLIVDIYAIAKILGLDKRLRAISPFWIAISFAFSLPLERVIQRLLGYGLQNISADGACAVLQNTINDVFCEGVRIVINNQDVLVDLPCSGARAFLLLLFFFSLNAAYSRLNIKNATIGFFITIISAYLINVLRICVLAIFIGFPGLIFHIDVMAQPTHDVIGLALLSLGAIPIALWARSRTAQSQVIKQLPKTLIKDAWWLTQERFTFNKAYLAAGLMIMAVVITQIPKKAYDVSRKDLTINIPITLNGEFAVVNALLPKEEAYFTQYGGAAVKASYGDQSLLVVRTSAPLRHLHAPDDCLRGLGMDVEYRGVTYDPIPTAIYKATDDQGIDFRVAVTFVSSDQKYMTTNVSETVWRWTQNPSEDWIAVQRISKWDDPKHTTFDYAVMASFELPQPKLLNIAQLNGERR